MNTIQLLKKNAPLVFNSYKVRKIHALQEELVDLRVKYKETTGEEQKMILSMAQDIKSYIKELEEA